MGESLEVYIKDLFSNTVNELNVNNKNKKYAETFSYLGSKGHPPDCILKDGDAIEVKKIESKGSSLALNSSYPTAKIFANSKLITKACRDCEEWEYKDIIYAVGVAKNNKLNSLCFVYGEDYAASAEIYIIVREKIKNGIEGLNNIQSEKTNELGRVNRVDPLGITNLRIRGMWNIKNPMKVFEYIHKMPTDKKFTFMAIINDKKYYSFDEKQRNRFENIVLEEKKFEIRDINIATPDNPAKLKNAKLITFYI